jgi:hypothetical protein
VLRADIVRIILQLLVLELGTDFVRRSIMVFILNSCWIRVRSCRVASSDLGEFECMRINSGGITWAC